MSNNRRIQTIKLKLEDLVCVKTQKLVKIEQLT